MCEHARPGTSGSSPPAPANDIAVWNSLRSICGGTTGVAVGKKRDEWGPMNAVYSLERISARAAVVNTYRLDPGMVSSEKRRSERASGGAGARLAGRNAERA